MIKIINYGMGNTGSLSNMIKKAGSESEICSHPAQLRDSAAIVLPGVGSFDNGMEKLRHTGFLEEIKYLVLSKRVPLLGICLGMHLLFENSEEGKSAGLSFLNGNVTRFNFKGQRNSKNLKVPHMGWNSLHLKEKSDIFSGLDEEARFYFVHSYHVNCSNLSDIAATTNYGYEFVCSVQRNNIFGVQFHPEKSHRFGVQFFKNFIKVIDECSEQE